MYRPQIPRHMLRVALPEVCANHRHTNSIQHLFGICLFVFGCLLACLFCFFVCVCLLCLFFVGLIACSFVFFFVLASFLLADFSAGRYAARNSKIMVVVGAKWCDDLETTHTNCCQILLQFDRTQILHNKGWSARHTARPLSKLNMILPSFAIEGSSCKETVMVKCLLRTHGQPPQDACAASMSLPASAHVSEL